ncbi:MAG: dihydroorotate dehydrogenase [Actinomycetota bacterium]
MEAAAGVELGIEITGIRLKNPVLVSSGTFGNGREYAEWLDIEKLGGLTTKSVTLEPCPGNPPPRLWETPCGMLNSIGLENKGLEHFLAEELPWLSGLDLPVWVNVAGFSSGEYVELAREISGSGMADAIELNISCPNVKRGGIHFSADPLEASSLVERVKGVTDIPVYVKLTPRCGDLAAMARTLAAAGADGLSLINTVPAMAVDIETARPRLANLTGGLSGPAIHPIAVLAVWEVADAVDLPIIGMGGIWTWRDAVEMMMVGADAVAVGTLNFTAPAGTLDIIAGMADYLGRRGLATASQLVDMARREAG